MNESARSRLRAVVATAVVASSSLAGAAPALPALPAPADTILYARPVTLEEGLSLEWYPDLGEIRSGTLVVLVADPALSYPRQSAMPILYAGSVMALRFNVAYPSGTIVALIPGDVDLTTEPVWFGSPDLPERVDRKRAVAEGERAHAAGIVPLPAAALRQARDKGRRHPARA